MRTVDLQAPPFTPSCPVAATIPLTGHLQSLKSLHYFHPQFQDQFAHTSSVTDLLSQRNFAPPSLWSYHQSQISSPGNTDHHHHHHCSNHAMHCNNDWHVQAAHNHNGILNWAQYPSNQPEPSWRQATYDPALPQQVQMPANGYLDPRRLQHNMTHAPQITPENSLNVNLGSRQASRDPTPPSSNSRSVSPFCGNTQPTNMAWSNFNSSTNVDFLSMGENRGYGEEEGSTNVPYNQLLCRCLKEMEGYEALLKDIYVWFERNTDKARDPRQKGWQNSIRHNLSMNEAFVKGSRLNPHNAPPNCWMLSDEAIRNGVEPTTRFRHQQHPGSRARAMRNPYPQRQVSGAKGGRAARRSARLHKPGSGGGQSQSPSENLTDTPSRRSTPSEGVDPRECQLSTNGDFGMDLGLSLGDLANDNFVTDDSRTHLDLCATDFMRRSTVPMSFSETDTSPSAGREGTTTTIHPQQTSLRMEADRPHQPTNTWSHALMAGQPDSTAVPVIDVASLPEFEGGAESLQPEMKGGPVFEPDSNPTTASETPEMTINEESSLLSYGDEFFPTGHVGDAQD